MADMTFPKLSKLYGVHEKYKKSICTQPICVLFPNACCIYQLHSYMTHVLRHENNKYITSLTPVRIHCQKIGPETCLVSVNGGGKAMIIFGFIDPRFLQLMFYVHIIWYIHFVLVCCHTNVRQVQLKRSWE